MLASQDSFLEALSKIQKKGMKLVSGQLSCKIFLKSFCNVCINFV